MKPYTRSIIELFDGRRRYLIPLYQRQYAWRVESQLVPLWEDIQRAVERLDTDRTALTPHFMGAMVIAQVKTFGRQVQAFEVIDGQQRLTTFQLLLAAFRDVAAANGSEYAAQAQSYLLNEGVMEQPALERYKLWPSITDRRVFVSLVDSQADLDPIAPPPTDEDGYVRRATEAHAWFKARIAQHVSPGGEYDEHRLEILFEAMKDGLAVVSIELEGGDDPQTIFETLNSRGVELSASDLMRNFIFQRSKGLGQSGASLLVDKLYEKHWLPLDRAFWQRQERRGRLNRSRLNWMLTDHLSMHQAELVSAEELFERYRRWVLTVQPFASVEGELASITLTAGVERRLFEQNKDDEIGRFGTLASAFDVSTVLPLVVYLAAEANLGHRLPEALALLESYIVRRDICQWTTKNYNRFFVQTISRLREADGDKIDVLQAWLAGRTSEIDKWPTDDEFRTSWVQKPQYKSARQPRLRYIFERLEQAKRTALSEEITIKSSLTIEHIMPRSWRTYWPVPGFEHVARDDADVDQLMRQMDRDTYVDRMGNLTLLTHVLNTGVSNGPFSKKMPALRAHASLALNRELGAFDQWDEQAIMLRGGQLYEVARQVWVAPKPAAVPRGALSVGTTSGA